MGLDMYLERMPRYGNTTPREVNAIESYFEWKEAKTNPDSKAKNYTLKEWCGVDFKTLPPKKVRDFYQKHGAFGYAYWDVEQKYSGRYRITESVGYWRKANQIHNWFVEHVQDGIDDCCYHEEVTKETLELLLSTCQKVLDSWTMINNEIGVRDYSVAERLLPTQGGFFFGSTDYDEYYIRDIEDTIDIIIQVLDTTDFEKQMVYYVSSW